jgi:hypothetical protein
MVQIGNVPEIVAVKLKLAELQTDGLVEEWTLPCENLLTRLDAAIFFVSARPGVDLEQIWERFRGDGGFVVQSNTKRTLSNLDWQLQFSEAAAS